MKKFIELLSSYKGMECITSPPLISEPCAVALWFGEGGEFKLEDVGDDYVKLSKHSDPHSS